MARWEAPKAMVAVAADRSIRVAAGVIQASVKSDPPGRVAYVRS
jgi:hypothetical protein